MVSIRVETTLGIRVSFLCAKTKVAPLKKLSIPRLELLRCALLIKVLKDVLVALKGRVSIDSVYYWLDFETALCWVKGKENCWNPWVENRVVSIRNIINKYSWYHIADIPTRVCTVNDFKRWSDGLKCLYTDIDVISKFNGLQCLYMDIDVISKFNGLQCLYMDIDVISKFDGLQYLYTDIDVISKFDGLQY